MTETYLAIGEVARASGLTVSALRYYDQEEVFVPAIVDATTGYRRYAVAQLRAARLLAGMRRVGVPLADIAVALEQLSDTEVVRGILSAGPCLRRDRTYAIPSGKNL
jgi:DNA polymerase-3 subunit beta